MKTHKITVDGRDYTIGYGLAAVEEVALKYEYISALRQSLFTHPETGNADISMRRVPFIAEIALRHGGVDAIEDVEGGLPALQEIAVAFLDLASSVYAEDQPKKKAPARKKPRSDSET